MSSRLEALENQCREIRKRVLEIYLEAGLGHVTSCFSCTEIMVALFHGGVLRLDAKAPLAPNRDRFLLSKGFASAIVYAILEDRGFLPEGALREYAKTDPRFSLRLMKDLPGVEPATSSVGHGLGVAAGIALGARMSREDFLTFTLLGDGELYEGAVWEAAMFAAHQRLNNLIAIVDRNYLCTTDFTENIVALEPLEERWTSFGWDVRRVNGHSIAQLLSAFEFVRSRRSTQPLVIIADTVKGRGVEFMADRPLCHGAVPAGTDVEKARSALRSDS